MFPEGDARRCPAGPRTLSKDTKTLRATGGLGLQPLTPSEGTRTGGPGLALPSEQRGSSDRRPRSAGLTSYQASASCLFSLCLSKLFPTSFWQRIYLGRRRQREAGGQRRGRAGASHKAPHCGPGRGRGRGRAPLPLRSSVRSHFKAASWRLSPACFSSDNTERSVPPRGGAGRGEAADAFQVRASGDQAQTSGLCAASWAGRGRGRGRDRGRGRGRGRGGGSRGRPLPLPHPPPAALLAPKPRKKGLYRTERRPTATCSPRHSSGGMCAGQRRRSQPGKLCHRPEPRAGATPAEEPAACSQRSAPISLVMLSPGCPRGRHTAGQNAPRGSRPTDHPPSSLRPAFPRSEQDYKQACVSPKGARANMRLSTGRPTRGLRVTLPGPHSPVSFFKLCLQVSDPIPGPWVFLLQQIQAVDHWWGRWRWGRTKHMSPCLGGVGPCRRPSEPVPARAAGKAGTVAPMGLPGPFRVQPASNVPSDLPSAFT